MRVTIVSPYVVLALVVFRCAAATADGSLSVETVLIEGAKFKMGTPLRYQQSPKYHDDERPLDVTIDDFRIGKYPITAEQMCVFLNSPAAARHDRMTLYNHRDIGDYTYSTIALSEDGKYVPRKNAVKAPANQVTWKGAVLFCQWLSAETGRKYRLPAEAEWELAARGKELRKWPWGDEQPSEKYGERYDADKLHRLTWTTTPVGSHPANATPDGVHDLLGYIIGEWCANKYVAHPTAEQVTKPEIDFADMASDRVVRGYFHRPYSWGLPLTSTPLHPGRTWTRMHVHPINAVKYAARHGFRVVEEIDLR
jgi:formylglycine-generating enzyme required for sulfatase activity